MRTINVQINARPKSDKQQPNLREDDHLLAPPSVLHSQIDRSTASSRGHASRSGAHVDDSDVLVVRQGRTSNTGSDAPLDEEQPRGRCSAVGCAFRFVTPGTLR